MNSGTTETKGCTSPSIEPKKSARLAEKRKLREEAGTPVSEDDYYFTPLTKSANTSGKVSLGANRQSTPSPSLVKEKVTRSSSSSPFTNKSPHKSSPPTSLRASPVASAISPSKSQAILKSSAGYGATQAPSPSSSITSSSSSASSNASPVLFSAEPKSGKSHFKKTLKQVSPGSSAKEESLEEEKWLDALESGNLEDMDDELRQIKNPKFMTARQKALLEKKDRDLVGFLSIDELESSFEARESPKAVTVEMIKLRAEKSEKRRLLAKEKKEKDKKDTIEKILQKQQIKPVKLSPSRPKKKDTDLKIVYINRVNSITLTFPPGMDFPLQKSASVPKPPMAVRCGVQGCQNIKKYACSKTNIPLCSLTCYKKNMNEFLSK